MLIIHIINDGTGTDDAANYSYGVWINHEKIASGHVKGHNRADGWRALVRELVAPGMEQACKMALSYMSDDEAHADISDAGWARYDGVVDALRDAVS